METKIKIPNVHGTIFKLGKDIYMSYGDKTYATFGSNEIVTRKRLKAIAAISNAEMIILVDSTEKDALEGLGDRKVTPRFFYSTRTPYKWSSDEKTHTLNSNLKPIESLEEAKTEAVKREVRSHGENCVNVSFGLKYDVR